MKKSYMNGFKPVQDTDDTWRTKRLTARRARFLWNAILREDAGRSIWNPYQIPNKPRFTDGRKYRLVLEPESACYVMWANREGTK